MMPTGFSLDEGAMAAAKERLDRLTKPVGSLGRLEELGIRLAGIAGVVPPPIPSRPVVVVAACDHGVVDEGVTPWPRDVTAQMVANFLEGGAAVNALSREVGASVVVVDAGVASPLPAHPWLADVAVRRVTGNIASEPAFSRDEAAALVEAGRKVARSLAAYGIDLLATGDMGIGNTTPSAAVVAAVTGRSPQEVTGRGTGIDDVSLARKIAVVERALARSGPPRDGIGVLAELGGGEIAVIAGVVLGAAEVRVPVIADGVISLAGVLVASLLDPAALGVVVAGHRSTEPGASAALDHLGLKPLLDLDLRLGEGTGATLAIPLVRSAARVLSEMATFESAGVSERDTSG